MTSDKKRSGFVVLRHDVGPELTRQCESHFDWMFQVGDTLRTWATEPLADFQQPVEVACQSLSNHRLAYLNYEGEIEGDRGRVTRVLAGTFCLIDDDSEQFVAALRWDDPTGHQGAHVKIYRSLLSDDGLRVDESREDLRLRFSPGR